MKHLALRWLSTLLLLAWALAAQAQTCSPYMGQVRINEVRVGSSNKSAKTNQVELFNSAGVAPSVWAGWQLVVYYKSSATATPVKKGGYLLSTGFVAAGAFIYNNNKLLFLRNRSSRLTDVALVDASGAFIDYIAIEGRIQTVPACLGTPKVVDATATSDAKADIARVTDGGAWPAAVANVTAHTIGASNTCTAGGADLVVNNSVDITDPIINTSTVTYTVNVLNKSCTAAVNGIVITDSGISAGNLSALNYSASQGSTAQGATALVWTLGSLTAGSSATLTIAGKPRVLGPLTTTAAVTAPASGLVNTGDDSDAETITVRDYNLVGFDLLADSVTEGTDTSYSALLSSTLKPSAKITVSYSVSGSAGSGDSNLPASGSVVIDPADSNNPDGSAIDFTIRDDALHEATKSIRLTLTGVSSSDASVRLDSGTSVMDIELLDDDNLPDHYELALPGSAISCLPSTLTVTACADGSSPCSNPFAAAAGSTATLTASAGSLGTGSLSFDATGRASTTLSHPAAADGTLVSVTLSNEQLAGMQPRRCCADGVSCAAGNACSTSFNSAGFIVAAVAGGSAALIPAQTAGTASAGYRLRAVRSNTTTQACESALSGAASVNWAYQCQNPAACSASNLMTLDGGTPTAIQRNDSSGVSGWTAVPMTFDANGNAPFSFSFADVGQVRLWAAKTVNGATLTATSNAFVTRPAGFRVSALAQTASPQRANPAAADAAGARFVAAGESFSANVTAVTAGGAATPNFGHEASPEGVVLSPALVLPAGGAAGTLANASLAGSLFGGGSASTTNLSFSEVGIITLTPAVADGDYLGAGNVVGTPTGHVGRFVPARFALSGAALTPRAGLSCTPASAFGYLGENFRLVLTLTAQNAGGTTTQNYSGSFARLDPASAGSWNLAGVDGGTVFSGASGRLSLGSASGNWSAGVANAVTLTANAGRAGAPDGPFDARFGIAPVDSDGVAMAAHDLDVDSAVAGNDHTAVGNVALRFGRLRLSNAAGAADRTLALPLAAHYWTGSAFDTNTLDSCTTLAPTVVSFGHLRRSLTSADTAVTGAVTLVGGRGSLRLTAPGGGRSGTVDVALSLGISASDSSCMQPWTQASGDAATAGANLAHLRGAWCGSSYDRDPAARASFGLQHTQDNTLYRRENY
jgi:hypothetical protein